MPGERVRAFNDQRQTGGTPGSPNPCIGVYFACSNQYLRVFRNHAATHYLARCPKCAKTIQFRVEAGGTDQRFFEVSC